MKTTRRFLSIVLMLAMLVSMFTFMASATDTCGTGTTNVTHTNHWIEADKVTAKDATCTEDGTYECHHCMDCGKWVHFDGTNWITSDSASAAKIPATEHPQLEVKHEENYHPYAFCADCGKYFAVDETNGIPDFTNTYNSKDRFAMSEEEKKACKHTDLTQMPDADKDDYYPYAYCNDCKKFFAVSFDVVGNKYVVSAGAVAKDSKEAFKRTPIVETKAYKLTVETEAGYATINGEKKSTLENIVKGTEVTIKAYNSSRWTFSYWKAEGMELTRTQKYSKTLKIEMPESNVKLTAVYTREYSCSHDFEYSCINSTYHWKVCEDCELTVKEEHTIKTGHKNGFTYKYCAYCDWTSYAYADHSSNHTSFTYDDVNSTYHDKICKKCDYEVREYHTWIKNTDRKTKDSYPYVCKYCDRLSKTGYTDLPFHDVKDSYWYYDDVLYAYLNGLMDGVSVNDFGASKNTTRGQVVTILWRLTGEPRATKENKFYDVSSSAYYNNAISWAVDAGIVDGFDAHTFKPDAFVTREQLAAILYRYAQYMNLSTKGASNLTKFDDYYSIGTWAREALAWANYNGLIDGIGYSKIDPKGNATRAQVAAILHRFAVNFG